MSDAARRARLCVTNILWTNHFGTFILFAKPKSSPSANGRADDRLRPRRAREDEWTAQPISTALKARLIQIKPDLPKRLQQVAAFALENPQEMALGTASSIAARAQVQASTLVRFAQAIGFGGFSELQARVPLASCATAGPTIPNG